MKKIFWTVFVLTLTITGCKKSEQCYSCTYGIINGYQRPPDTYCGDITKYQPKDANGNDMQYFCQPK